MAGYNLSTSTSGELDRRAIIIHLKDVLALEYIKKKLHSKFNYLQKHTTDSQNVSYIKDCRINIFGTSDQNNWDHIYLLYDGSKFFVAMNRCDSYYDDTVYDGSWLASKTHYWLEIEPNIKKLTNRKYWKKYGASLLDNIKYSKRAINEFLRVYGEFKRTAQKDYDNKYANNNRMLKNKQGIEREYWEADRLLTKVYNCNIIPGPFRRNIYAIYYLYDFLSTSRESLSAALLHYDLNEIKKKLDKIIEQQEEIIIQNAILESQNSRMIEQNAAMLTNLANIESNTDRAAQYAEIAAKNAEACAWISLANYIKN